MLERELELDALAGVFADARGGGGRLAVVEGPAGQGKSSLLAAAVEGARAEGMRVLSARGGEFERAFAFGAIRQLFERALGEADEEARGRLLAGAAAGAEAVVAPGQAVPAEPGFATLHALYWLTANLAMERPLAIVVDDLHWVDDPSLRALGYLGNRIGDLPVALIVALRPAEPDVSQELLDAICDQPGATTLRLRPLSAEAVTVLVSQAAPDADAELCAACLEASAGNPFYLHELVAGLEGEVAADSVRRATVPSLGDRIVRRIERIGPEAVPLAQAMAVLGDDGSLDAAAAVCGVDGETAAGIVARLRRIEVLAAEDPFAFAHPLVLHSVYDSLTVAERDRLHAAAAQVLGEAGAPPGVIAAHLARLRPTGSSEVVRALQAAAGEALASGAPDAAVAALRRALEEEADEPPRAVLLREVGELEIQSRDFASLAHLTEALELADDDGERTRAAVAFATVSAGVGQWDDALGVLNEVQAGLADDEQSLRLELDAMRAIMLGNDSAYQEAYDGELPRMLEAARGDSWPARALASVICSIWVNRGERLDEARLLAAHALEGGHLYRERGVFAWPVPQVLMTVVMTEEDEWADAMLAEVTTVAREQGSAHGNMLGALLGAWLAGRQGDLVAAEGAVQVLGEIYQQLDIATMYWALTENVGERPGLDAFVAPVEEVELEGGFARTVSGPMAREARARLRLGRGDREGALADLRVVAEIYTPLRISPLRSSWRSLLALALAPDHPEEAMTWAEEEVRLAEEVGRPRSLGIALRRAATVGREEDEVECLRRSAELLEGTSARLEQARSLLALGSALRRRGHRAEAREPLATALELAHRCGAEATEARAAEELRAAGARPRRPVRSGLDALTASEARVARLVAAGSSNAEVAQELFVSLKTVETHLGRAYSKLGLSGRAARGLLPGALGREKV